MFAGGIPFPGSVLSYTNSRQSTPPLFLFPSFFKGRGFPSSSRFSSSSLFTASSFPTWEMKRSNRLVLRIANSVRAALLLLSASWSAPFTLISTSPTRLNSSSVTACVITSVSGNALSSSSCSFRRSSISSSGSRHSTSSSRISSSSPI